MALLGALFVGSGCVIILPTIPTNVPAYGNHYVLVDERGKALEQQGLLLMRSIYAAGPDLVRCFPVDRGIVDVPKASKGRYFGSLWGPIVGPPWGYFGMFMNPKFTIINPLVPGYVPAGWPENPDWDYLVSSNHPHRERVHLHLMRADPELECEYLSGAVPSSEVLESEDQTALDRAQQYVQDRLKVLEALPEAGAPPAEEGRPP